MSNSKRPADNMSGADDLDEPDPPNVRRRLEDSIYHDATDEDYGTPVDLPSSRTMSMS